jgi:hypothetical protein
MIRAWLVEAAMPFEHRYTRANAAIADMRGFAGDKALDLALAPPAKRATLFRPPRPPRIRVRTGRHR